ncbi:sushi repeat-containing protein SRPX2-like isoform X1 [Hemitrygon akajei]|uniref:sushi repeat-containing protein SRPX2-like isoform X1 n=1 Tax=Hemitrygon akajei TaxID=2704970 RepID=UPI003BFA22BA
MRGLFFLFTLTVRSATGFGFGYGSEGSGYSHAGTHDVDYSVQYTESSYHLRYKEPRWCYPLSIENGVAECYSPRGPNYRSTLGTRCHISCDRGFKLFGRRQVECRVTRRWSGISRCREVRCYPLPVFPYGSYVCSKGIRMDSQCEYNCEQGYQLEGDRTRICLQNGHWSGTEPLCVDYEPPRIKCPGSREKVAEPGKVTARVYWDPPRIKDVVDKYSTKIILKGPSPGSEFEKGEHVIRYVAYDRERNKATCKFTVTVYVRRCPPLRPPANAYITCTSGGNNYGATCTYTCEGGYELRGIFKRVCLFSRSWSGIPPSCVRIQINVDVNSAAALLDQFYEMQHLLIISSPSASDTHYRMQINLLQEASCGLELRQITIIELIGMQPKLVGRIREQQLSLEIADELRQVYYLSDRHFDVVLVDKYGTDRERYIQPVTPSELFSFIDEYLLKVDERAAQQQKEDSCT